MQIYVDVPTPSIEKPEAQQNYAAGQAQYGDGIFTANVGLSPEAEKAYKKEIEGFGATFRKVRKAIQDCAGLVGIPAPDVLRRLRRGPRDLQGEMDPEGIEQDRELRVPYAMRAYCVLYLCIRFAGVIHACFNLFGGLYPDGFGD